MEKVGVSMYTFNLLKEFHKHADSSTQFITYLRNTPQTDLPEENDNFKYVVVSGSFAWSHFFFPLHLFTHKKPDILFCPAHYIPPFCPLKTVVTIHDLAYFYYPNEFLPKDLFKLKNWTNYALKKSSKVISVSENTKKDIVKFYKIPENKIQVIHNSFNPSLLSSSPPPPPISPSSPPLLSKYILYVGTLQPRKNISALIDAFVILKKDHLDLSLILAGKKGWLYDEIFEKVKNLNLEKSVIFSGYISEAEKNELYKNASVFVLPSLYEGFGNTPLEALAVGTPVAVSNNSSLPEICGDACLYFDPNDTIDMAKKIDMILTDPNLRQILINKGKEHVKQFSWESCAKETLEVLRDPEINSG